MSTNPTPNKEGFVLYARFYEATKHLSLEDKGRLFDAIFIYQLTKELPDKESPVYTAFMFIKNQFDLDDIKYNSFIELQKEKGRKSAEKRWGKKK